MVHVGQVFIGYLGHIGAPAHLHGDQSLGGQHLERFAQRGAAYAVFLGMLEFVNPAAGFELAAEDALAQQFSHFFVKGARRERQGGHGGGFYGETAAAQGRAALGDCKLAGIFCINNYE